ncbi:MAG: hypothetical protein Q8L64_01145 [bacterium]|nr:hypothetical protein [bacterium]
MKRIKEFLDFLITLVNAWKVVLPILLLCLSAVFAVLKIGNKNISINLPVWLVIAIATLALYPFAKLIEHLVNKKRSPNIKVNGLLWKPSLFSFRYPEPLCPHNDCERKVICRVIPPNPLRVVTSISEINNAKFEYRYVYECPIHGQINGVPNDEISLLQEKAKAAFTKG